MLDWLKRTPVKTVAREGDELFDARFQAKLESLALAARRVYAGESRAMRRSRKTGSGIEFADFREYAPGDDFRHIDWGVYARTDRLLLRLFEEEEDLAIYILLDTSASMAFGAPQKLTVGKQLTAALAYVALSNLDRVSVNTVSDVLGAALPPTRGKARIFGVFDFLKRATADGKTDLFSAAKNFIARNRRRGVVVVISDFYDIEGTARTMDALRYAKFEPHLIHLRDENDARLPLDGDVSVIDAETGEIREVTVTKGMLTRARSVWREHAASLEKIASEKHVPYHALDIHMPLEDAVLGILRRGGLLK